MRAYTVLKGKKKRQQNKTKELEKQSKRNKRKEQSKWAQNSTRKEKQLFKKKKRLSVSRKKSMCVILQVVDRHNAVHTKAERKGAEHLHFPCRNGWGAARLLERLLACVAIWLKERHSRFSRVQPKSWLFAHLLPVEEYDDADKADTRFFLVIALIPLHGRPAPLPVVVAGL